MTIDHSESFFQRFLQNVIFLKWSFVIDFWTVQFLNIFFALFTFYCDGMFSYIFVSFTLNMISNFTS